MGGFWRCRWQPDRHQRKAHGRPQALWQGIGGRRRAQHAVAAAVAVATGVVACVPLLLLLLRLLAPLLPCQLVHVDSRSPTSSILVSISCRDEVRKCDGGAVCGGLLLLLLLGTCSSTTPASIANSICRLPGLPHQLLAVAATAAAAVGVVVLPGWRAGQPHAHHRQQHARWCAWRVAAAAAGATCAAVARPRCSRNVDPRAAKGRLGLNPGSSS